MLHTRGSPSEADIVTQEHPVCSLFERLSGWEYPPGVAAVPQLILGTGFFPGACGLWCGGRAPGGSLPAFPRRGVMVLGQDFHLVRGYEESLARGHEDMNMPTWRNLLPLLEQAGVAKESCFFTNAYMGLREAGYAIGPFPGVRSAAFVGRCRRFFVEQVDAQHPRLVLTLGMAVIKFLAETSPSLQRWKTSAAFRVLDEHEGALVEDVEFTGARAPACVVAALTHPCLRNGNVRRRRWRGLEGAAAELDLLREAKTRADRSVGGSVL